MEWQFKLESLQEQFRRNIHAKIDIFKIEDSAEASGSSNSETAAMLPPPLPSPIPAPIQLRLPVDILKNYLDPIKIAELQQLLIPKVNINTIYEDNKRCCLKCKNHGVQVQYFTGHNKTCTFLTCRCSLCHLVDAKRRKCSEYNKKKVEQRNLEKRRQLAFLNSLKGGSSDST